MVTKLWTRLSITGSGKRQTIPYRGSPELRRRTVSLMRHLHSVQRLSMNGAVPPLLLTLLRSVTKHRHNFTFSFMGNLGWVRLG